MRENFKGYKGILVDDEYKKIHNNMLKNGDIYIYNRDQHWSAIFKLNGKLYEYDSYNRDLLGNKFKDYKIGGFVQGKNGIDNSDCFQRTASA